MGKAKYVFRMDDISYDMDFDKFFRFKELLDKFRVKPLIGVIPANKNHKFIEFGNQGKRKNEEEFWQIVKELNWEWGWVIALHGYDHVYLSRNTGLLKYQRKSEFAGVEVEEQYRKISEGKRLLEKKGLKISAFMAPAHTFDRNTLEVLKRNDLDVVTDGFGVYSYKKRGITFVPQLFARPRKMPIGLYTFCFHTNTMDEKDFIEAERFLSRNWRDVISFEEAIKISADSLPKRALNLLVFLAMYFRMTLRLIFQKKGRH